MRGKYLDLEFISSFIQECTLKNKSSPEEICDEALLRMEEIDKMLKMRMKFSDVLNFFDLKKVKKNSNDSMSLSDQEISFDSLNKEKSIFISNLLMNNPVKIDDLINECMMKFNSTKRDVLFDLKSLIDKKVIFKASSDFLTKGDNYKAFIEKHT